MPNDVLLTAKLRVPALRADHVPRPRLVARLEAGLARKLTLVSTQTGSGKTTILSEWLTQKNIPSPGSRWTNRTTNTRVSSRI